jgi:hypothetical protein
LEQLSNFKSFIKVDSSNGESQISESDYVKLFIILSMHSESTLSGILWCLSSKHTTFIYENVYYFLTLQNTNWKYRHVLICYKAYIPYFLKFDI